MPYYHLVGESHETNPCIVLDESQGIRNLKHESPAVPLDKLSPSVHKNPGDPS